MDWPVWLLFWSAFVSATLLPGGSEAIFAALVWRGEHALSLLLAAATVGNTLGGMTSWGIGRLAAWRWPAERLTTPTQRRAVDRVRRWGAPVLLFSWVPVIGDPLCAAAGWLRVHWLLALVLIGVGKFARYAAVAWAMPVGPGFG
ncbi:DedA family protein [Ectothiorhodospiraceae bacterium 2226]|nr:DedA family protein [Ectothiorhodospiraceae bacterium 2226]